MYSEMSKFVSHISGNYYRAPENINIWKPWFHWCLFTRKRRTKKPILWWLLISFDVREFSDTIVTQFIFYFLSHIVDQLVAILLDFFIAGALTTSYTLDFAVLATVSNPQVQERLHQELDKVLQRKQMPSMADKSRWVMRKLKLIEIRKIEKKERWTFHMTRQQK